MLDDEEKLYRIGIQLRMLTVFHDLLKDPVIGALLEFLESGPFSLNYMDPGTSAKSVGDNIVKYTEFVSRLYDSGSVNLTHYVQEQINNNENIYIRNFGSGKPPSQILEQSAMADLEALSAAASLTPADLKAKISGFCSNLFWPEFESHSVNFQEAYRERVANINQYGYGIYAKYHMFFIDGSAHITPVGSPDPVQLDDLIDYQKEKQVIVDNTLALLAGKPAANILLTGDAGTGKSSTVKAVANKFWNRGLRIIEMRKEQLHEIPGILKELNENPLKFILFIDDLSFQKDDDNFSALKAMLEGSVSAKSKNVVIYATSNRRHLVKERFSDREGDDIHRGDAMQEVVSLSERFGLRVTFQRPDKATYLNIVRRLAEEAGLALTDEELCAGAERFALGRSARSARAARQYVDGLLSAR